MKNQRKVLKGLSNSKGIVIGQAWILTSQLATVSRKKLQSKEVDCEIPRFERALKDSKKEMQGLLQQRRFSSDLSAIFEAQLTLLGDPMLTEEIRNKIRLQKFNAEWVLKEEIHILKDFLLKSKDVLFQERAADLEDIGNRILRNLIKRDNKKLENETIVPKNTPPIILVGKSIAPSIFLQLPLERIEGIALSEGGLTGHLAILAKAHKLPIMVQVKGLLEHIKHKETIFLNCLNEELIVSPGHKELELYRSHMVQKIRSQAVPFSSPLQTKDGVRIEIWANIDEKESSANEILQEVSGIGLFRTEFLYFKEPQILKDMQDHTAVYREILRNLHPKPVQFRLLDIEDDKPFPREFLVKEKRLRGIRFLLANEKYLCLQLESILRAASSESIDGQCRILIPMVSDLEEVLQVKNFLKKISKKLETEYGKKIPHIPLGIMIETPAAVALADILAKEADYFCIGSSDLVCLNQAFERNSSLSLEELFYQPSFYRQLNDLMQFQSIPIMLCGALSSETKVLPLLFGLGLRRFSMPISSMADSSLIFQELISDSCKEMAHKALQLGSAKELNRILS